MLHQHSKVDPPLSCIILENHPLTPVPHPPLFPNFPLNHGFLCCRYSINICDSFVRHLTWDTRLVTSPTFPLPSTSHFNFTSDDYVHYLSFPCVSIASFAISLINIINIQYRNNKLFSIFYCSTHFSFVQNPLSFALKSCSSIVIFCPIRE